MQIGRRIYFYKTSGNVIQDTGEREGGTSETPQSEDFEIYESLVDVDKEEIDFVQLEYGQYKKEFDAGKPFTVDTKTKQLIFQN